MRQCIQAARALGCVRLQRGHFVAIAGRPPSLPLRLAASALRGLVAWPARRWCSVRVILALTIIKHSLLLPL